MSIPTTAAIQPSELVVGDAMAHPPSSSLLGAPCETGMQTLTPPDVVQFSPPRQSEVALQILRHDLSRQT
jgi:hypothetical protein